MSILRPAVRPGPQSGRLRFRASPLQPPDPDWYRLDDRLDPQHTARLSLRAVCDLDFTPLFAAYAGRGSPAYPPGRLLAAVLYEIHQGHRSPAQWFRPATESDPVRWLLGGQRPRCTRPGSRTIIVRRRRYAITRRRRSCGRRRHKRSSARRRNGCGSGANPGRGVRARSGSNGACTPPRRRRARRVRYAVKVPGARGHGRSAAAECKTRFAPQRELGKMASGNAPCLTSLTSRMT